MTRPAPSPRPRASKPIYGRIRKKAGRVWIDLADAAAYSMVDERNYADGDLIRLEITKPRDYGQLKRAHKIGTLARTQLPGFEALDSHEAVKKLQVDSGMCCDVTRTDLCALGLGYGVLESRQAKTIAFDKMDEAEFQALVKGICLHIHEKYWPAMHPLAIEQMMRLEDNSRDEPRKAA